MQYINIALLEKEFEVIHDKKGMGKTCGYIRKREDGFEHYYLKIKFYETGEIGEFYYPDQFKLHLKACDPQIQQNILNPVPSKKPRLIFDTNLGSNTRTLYEHCVELFGWDSSKKGHFGARTLLFAKSCTPEGYSVWGITHSNLMEPINSLHTWYNIVRGEFIEEVWLNATNEVLYHDWSDRIAWIKCKDGYHFYGIYRPQEVVEREIYHKICPVKIYKRISSVYPN